MRKTFYLFVAMALCMLGVTKSYAEVRVPLTADMFCTWDGVGVDAHQTGQADCEMHIGEEVGSGTTLFGASSVYYLSYANLSGAKSLEFEGTSGMQLRVLMNRVENEGALVERNVTIGDDGKAVVDVSDLAYVHLNAIKTGWGSPAGTINSMVVVKESEAPAPGWQSLIINGNLEGDDNSCFFLVEQNGSGLQNAEIIDGVGFDGSRGIMVQSADEPANDWATQFFIRSNEIIPIGTKIHVEFDYRADQDGDCDTQAHREPQDYIHYEMIGSPHFTTDWQHYTYEGEITSNQGGDNNDMQTIAFNLAKNKVATQFFFDNIQFSKYQTGVDIRFNMDMLQINFGYDTNVADLVKAGGAKRLLFPTNCVHVKVNGEQVTLLSVEGFEDGKFYAFIDQGYPESEDDIVEVAFNNPFEPEFHLIYGENAPEGDVPNFGYTKANYDENLDVYPFAYETPTLISADPEDGSFNLPVNISEFKVTFDKLVDCAAVVAKLDNAPLAVVPSTGFAKELTLKRASTDLVPGEYTITLTKVYPELRLSDEVYGEYSYVLNIGPINSDPDDVPYMVMQDNFLETINSVGEGMIPVGWSVYNAGNIVPQGTNPGSGPRSFKFGAGGDFEGSLYFRTADANDGGRLAYGETEGYEMPLEAGKKYAIHYNVAAWKGTPWVKFEIIDGEDNVVLERIDAAVPNMNGAKDAIKGSTVIDFKYRPETTGNFKLQWTPVANANGDGGGWLEALLGNVSVKYLPNAAGVEETQLLLTALQEAKATRDANLDERYDGAAFSALVAAINKYDGQTYTAPSAYRNAAAELNAVTQAMKDHRSLCDTYDPLPVRTQELVDQYAGTPYEETTQYQNLKAVNDKYAGKVLKDDEELKAAIEELNKAISICSSYFTEGVSRVGTTGIAALKDRIRLGLAVAEKLGIPQDDPAVIAGNNTLSDDDNVAEMLKNAIKGKLYSELKNPDNTLFEEQVDDNTLETYTETYEMTVFVKNPNLYYASDVRNDFVNYPVPGWDIENLGGYDVSWTSGWSQVATKDLPADGMLSNWNGGFTCSQTIEDLPAGIYTIKAGYGERQEDGDPDVSFFSVQTTSDEEPQKVSIPIIGQTFPTDNVQIENVVVTDGILTLCAETPVEGNTHTFFNQVSVWLTAPANGFDYNSAYEEYLLGVDTPTQAAKVRAIELYDLNGRRIVSAQKGVMIVKKHMSDGTIKTEKVIKK